MDRWDEPFACRYEYVRVSRATGNELEAVSGIRNGGTIERNQDSELFESASLPFVGGFDIGTDLLRVYLVAEFLDGTSARECLGTFLPVVPEREAPLDSGTVELNGRLKEMADNGFDEPRAVMAGANAVQEAAAIVRECGLECIADESGYRLSSTWVFGAGATGAAQGCDTALSAANALLEVAGFSAARTDQWGRVLLRKYAEPSERKPSHAFAEGGSARFEVTAKDAFDTSAMCNVVYVDYSAQGQSIRGVAVDDDERSPLSVQAMGRRVVHRYEYSDLPCDTPDDANMLSGAERCELGVGTKESGTFRISGGGGTVAQCYAGDCPVPGVCLGMKVVSEGGELGFTQDGVCRLEQGKSYTMSVWCKGEPGLRVVAQAWWGESGNEDSPKTWYTCDGSWQLLESSGAAASSREASMGYCYVESAGTAVFACPKVEEGDSATPWPNQAMKDAADAKAAELLRTERAAVRTVSLRHVYAPVAVSDAVDVSYPTGAISGRFAVRAQTLSLGAGCPIDAELRAYERPLGRNADSPAR